MCDTDDTIQDFEFKTFRFSQQSAGDVYLYCRVKACLADDAVSDCNFYCDVCQGGRIDRRKRRSPNQNSRNSTDPDPYAKVYFVNTGPIRVAKEQKGIGYSDFLNIILSMTMFEKTYNCGHNLPKKT